jgi:8-oxo-dGTP diphosphatase
VEFTDYDTRLGGYAVIIRDDHVLLALWNEPEVPTWTLPGGGIELHEDLEDGVVREVLEESGYGVVLDGLLGVDTRVVPPERRYLPAGDRSQKNVRVVYAATVTGGELTHEVGGSTSEARWVPLVEVPALVREPLVEKFVG